MKKPLYKRISDIEAQGYKVEIEHIREYFPKIYWKGTIKDPVRKNGIGPVKPNGGRTQAKILGTNGNLIAFASAECSENDNYNRKIGANIALGRAEKELETFQWKR